MLRLSGLLVLGFCAAFLWCGSASARAKAATAKPKRIMISAEKPSAVRITWYVKGTHAPKETVRVTMGEGNFFLGDRKGAFLDFVPQESVKEFRAEDDGTYLTAFKETVTITRAMIEQAAAENKSIYYERRFMDHTLEIPVLAHVILQPVRSVGDTLAVTAVKLEFIDRTGLCQIATGEGLRAEALIDVEGSGMIEGRWEIRKRPFLDEFRTLKTVHHPVKDEIVLGLTSPDLPSEVSGPVDVRLVITEPKAAAAAPMISCLVRGTGDAPLEATTEAGTALRVLAPAEAVPITAQMRIQWKGGPDYRFFRIVFAREDGGVMAATDTPRGVDEIEVPADILAQLTPGQPYQVKVRGYR